MIIPSEIEDDSLNPNRDKHLKEDCRIHKAYGTLHLAWEVREKS